MTLTEQQKQALREKVASAKVQSKLPPEEQSMAVGMAFGLPEEFAAKVADTFEQERQRVSHETIGTGEEAYQEAEAQAAGLQAIQPDVYLQHTPEEETGGLDEKEWKFQVNVPIGDPAMAASMVKQAKDIATELDEVPWEEAIPTTSLQTVASQQLVEGFVLKPGMSMEQIEELSEQIFSYIGAEPVHVGKYVGRWIKVLGGVALPLEGDIIDEETGEVNHLKWTQARLKLAAKDDATGEHIIVYGGGNNGLQFVRHMTSLYGPGDWGRPKEVLISHETRKNGHVLYHFRHRRIQQQ